MLVCGLEHVGRGMPHTLDAVLVRYLRLQRNRGVHMAQVMEPVMRNTRLFTDTGKAAIYRVTGQFSEMV